MNQGPVCLLLPLLLPITDVHFPALRVLIAAELLLQQISQSVGVEAADRTFDLIRHKERK